MSTSPNLHGMSDAAARSFDRLVACPFAGCNGGDVDGQPCERCGGEGRVAPPPALPAMPKPAVVAAEDVRREVDPVRALTAANYAIDTQFEVWRTVDGEHVSCLVTSFEVNESDLATMTAAERELYREDERRWALVFRVIERIADEEEAHRRDGETCVHNAEPAPELVAECQSDQAFVDAYERDIDTAAE